MALPRLTYLCVESLAAGVTSSQVLPYVERLAAHGVAIELHSFEPGERDGRVAARLDAAGVDWRSHPYGAAGARGGVSRLARAALHLRGAELVHARSDLAAVPASLHASRPWIWDCRAFLREQRIFLGMLREGSAEERLLARLERRVALRSHGIVTVAAAAVPVLRERYGDDVAAKCTVIPPCADLDRFRPSPAPPADTLRLLLSGSLNRYYDMPAMLRMVALLQARRPTTLTVLSGETATPWESAFAGAGATRSSARQEEMAQHVADHHVGLSVCRLDAGTSLPSVMPVKVAEFLAAGRPVVVSAGLGDLEAIVAEHGCGVVVRSTDEAGIATAADELEALLERDDLVARCRAAAEAHFDVDRGVERLLGVYEAVAGA